MDELIRDRVREDLITLYEVRWSLTRVAQSNRRTSKMLGLPPDVPAIDRLMVAVSLIERNIEVSHQFLDLQIAELKDAHTAVSDLYRFRTCNEPPVPED